jgi:putative ABC transport system permease protein
MKTQRRSPPRLAVLLLSWVSWPGNRLSILGDYEELFHAIVLERGLLAARTWYWSQALKSLPAFIANQIFWSFTMIRNIIKTALRNIRKSKGYSLVNILGLALGMTSSFLIFLTIRYEFSFDRFHGHADQIYRVNTEWTIDGRNEINETTVAPVAPSLLADFPEIQKAVRIERIGAVVKFEDRSFVENRVYLVDAGFLDLFNFPLVQGNPDSALSDLNSIVITEEAARKYFGDRNPLGQRLTFWNSHDFVVTAVARDVPRNTNLDFDFLARFELVNPLAGGFNYLGSWGAWNFETFVLLQEGRSASDFEGKTGTFLKKYRGQDSDNPVALRLQPLRRIHLESGGRIRYIELFTAIASVILALACINFMNLSVAQSLTRAREIGMRKVVGAGRPQIVRQFLTECLILTVLALPLALFLTVLFLPFMNSLLMTDLQLGDIRNLPSLSGMIGTVLLVSFLSGSYPSLYLSAFRPIESLKGEIRSGKGVRHLRSALVVFQFAASIILISGTLIIRKQMRFIHNADLGFQPDHIVTVPIRAPELGQASATVKEELLRDPRIAGVTVSSFTPGNHPNQSVDWEGRGENEELMMAWYAVDHDFVKTFGIDLLAGRDFSTDFPSDLRSAYILNEAAVKVLGWSEPIGKRFRVEIAGLSVGTVVGVVKDFHFDSLHSQIKPLALILMPGFGQSLSIKISPQDIGITLSFIAKTVKSAAPSAPYNYAFLDEDISRMYVTEERLQKLADSFSVIALFIASIGLLGLASFSTSRRTKEIGIRKVFGASTGSVVVLLSREFGKWVVMANLIAWPIAYYAMNRWFRGFAYRTRISTGVFLLAGGASLFAALLTISSRTIRAASADPVDSLRYE